MRCAKYRVSASFLSKFRYFRFHNNCTELKLLNNLNELLFFDVYPLHLDWMFISALYCTLIERSFFVIKLLLLRLIYIIQLLIHLKRSFEKVKAFPHSNTYTNLWFQHWITIFLWIFARINSRSKKNKAFRAYST